MSDQDKRELVANLASLTSSFDGRTMDTLNVEADIVIPPLPLMNCPLVRYVIVMVKHKLF